MNRVLFAVMCILCVFAAIAHASEEYESTALLNYAFYSSFCLMVAAVVFAMIKIISEPSDTSDHL